ncbi:hypothetical protein LB503_006958 [Fusarium chuoi]|nr:hypothetical protein LB503_006958 [Fusarium chuoi]
MLEDIRKGPRPKSTKSLPCNHVPGGRLNSGGRSTPRQLQHSVPRRCAQSTTTGGVKAEKSDKTWRNRVKRGERRQPNRNGVARCCIGSDNA